MKLNGQNLVIAFLAASTLGLGVQLYHTRQQLEDARKAPTLQVKRSDIQVAAAPEAIKPPPTAPAVAEAPLPEALPAAPDGEGRPPGGRNRGGARFAAQIQALMKDPEFAAAWKLDQLSRLDQRYGALFKQLNLPPDQLGSLKNLLIERENAGREVWATAAAQGLNPRDNREELRKLTADLQAEVDNSIKATFGDSILGSLNAYAASAPQRATVSDLSQRLNYTGQPLNDSQAQQLTRILAETGATNGRGVTITEAAIARAQGVLMPAQIDALKSLQAEQQARQLLADKMRKASEQAQATRPRQ